MDTTVHLILGKGFQLHYWMVRSMREKQEETSERARERENEGRKSELNMNLSESIFVSASGLQGLVERFRAVDKYFRFLDGGRDLPMALRRIAR